MISGALAWLLLGLSLLNIVLVAALGIVLLRLRRRMKRARRADKARRQIAKHHRRAMHRFNMATWRQVEGLFSLYRMLDDRTELPRMRFGPVSPDFLLHIIERMRSDRPKTIVECGSGTSTIVLAHMLKALGIDSHIYAIENHQPSIDKVRQLLRRNDLERFVNDHRRTAGEEALRRLRDGLPLV
jgi:predicted O-methyltransferase YrrM